MAIKRSYVLPEDSSMITWRHVYESSLKFSLLVGGKRDAPGNAPASLFRLVAPASLFKLVVLLLFSCNVPLLLLVLLLVLVVLLLFSCTVPLLLLVLLLCSFGSWEQTNFYSVDMNSFSWLSSERTWFEAITNQSHARVILLKEKYLCWTVTHYLLITLQWTGDNVSVARTVGVATASFITFENVENADNKLLLTITYGFSTMLRMLRMLITISSCCS